MRAVIRQAAITALMAGILLTGLHLVFPHRFFDARYPPKFYGVFTLPDATQSMVHWQLSAMATLPEPQDVLLLGDSSCLFGLHPQRIAQALGLKTRGFGTCGYLTVEGHRRLLEFYLRRFPPPRIVLYHVSYTTLCESGSWRKASIQYLDRLRRFTGEPALLSTLEKMDPRGFLRDRLHRALGRDVERRPMRGWGKTMITDAEIRAGLLTNDGWLPNDEEKEFPASLPIRCALEPGTAAELRELFRLAETRGFDLALILNPLPDVAATPTSEASMVKLEADLRSLARTFPRVRMLPKLARYYPTAEFGRVTHLKAGGAGRNTDDVIAWLRQPDQWGRLIGAAGTRPPAYGGR